MRSLSELQEDFQAYLLHQGNAIQADITHTEALSSIKRLEIYRDAYYLRLLESLTQDYSVVYAMMGEEPFNQFAYDYILAHPSRFKSIRWFGNRVAHFMQKTEPYCNQSWLIELAEFEWLLTEAFDERDSDIVTIEHMATIPFESWPDMQFALHPSFRKITLHWNVASLWDAYKEQNTLLSPQKTDDPISWIIWRKDQTIHFRSLTLDEAYVIDAMHLGKSFSTICEGLCEWVAEDHVAMHGATLLKRFIIDKQIANIILQE